AEQELPLEFFEHSISDVQAYHSTVLARSRKLNEAPLLTFKHREEERMKREKNKVEKWPNTTIRIKFSDGTQIQNIFPSSSPIQPVYQFVRSALIPEVISKSFILWQPPRTQYPEHPTPAPPKKTTSRTTIIPPANYGPVRGSAVPGLQAGTGGKESLNELGLVPQSVLYVKWEDESMNASGYKAPLLSTLLEKMVPLPSAAPKEQSAPKSNTSGSGSGEGKKIPKWLQKGLMKRK
ncbi:hypothetical protein TREMEDRAFT_33971, partial [Tremella mesenterica DSM 1558]|uniref:uncharacterized protein n=1 Tax=Tremella mesenterica (strain ATCC 24925 / CBS 8224 / DSM 1558 / NBRC 9311 / NRRL Y-6157 / RJB 2259-6 / UBC 559-6) TaxID=578456 RepID=UPI0003F49E27